MLEDWERKELERSVRILRYRSFFIGLMIGVMAMYFLSLFSNLSFGDSRTTRDKQRSSIQRAAVEASGGSIGTGGDPFADEDESDVPLSAIAVDPGVVVLSVPSTYKLESPYISPLVSPIYSPTAVKIEPGSTWADFIVEGICEHLEEGMTEACIREWLFQMGIATRTAPRKPTLPETKPSATGPI